MTLRTDTCVPTQDAHDDRTASHMAALGSELPRSPATHAQGAGAYRGRILTPIIIGMASVAVALRGHLGQKHHEYTAQHGHGVGKGIP